MTAGQGDLGETLVTARPLDEYRAMFSLAADDVAGLRILDCPGGASSFTAEASTLTARVTAVDPVYRRDVAELADLVEAETRRGNEYARRNIQHYHWDFYRDPEDHLRRRLAAIELFRRDVQANRARYVAGALPHLPYEDDAFDLALSSHLLFIYDDRLDEAFHLAALEELLRVAREVRIFPIVTLRGQRSGLVGPAARHLEQQGASVRVQQVPFEFQHGAHEMLVVRRNGVDA